MNDLKHENEICRGCVDKMKRIEELTERYYKLLNTPVKITTESKINRPKITQEIPPGEVRNGIKNMSEKSIWFSVNE